jgi:hypothetical protein
LGKEEAAEIEPQEKEFLHECLKVKRERGSPSSRMDLLASRWIAQHDHARTMPSRRFARSGISNRLASHGERFAGAELRREVAELQSTCAVMQARLAGTEKRTRRLEQKAVSNSKVATEFQRMWTGMTALAERINEELNQVRGRLDAMEQRGTRHAELSPIANKEADCSQNKTDQSVSFLAQKDDISIAQRDAMELPDLGSSHMTQTATAESKVFADAESFSIVMDAALENRKSVERVESEVRKLQLLFPDVSSMIQGMRRDFEQSICELQNELHISRNDLEQEVHRLNITMHGLDLRLNRSHQDLQQELHVDLKELDLKLERLTVVVGTAAFFHRAKPGCSVGDAVSTISGEIDRTSPQTAPSEQKAGEADRDTQFQVHKDVQLQDEAAHTTSLEEVHNMLRTLGLAIKALQQHAKKANVDLACVRAKFKSEYDSLRLDLRRQEVRHRYRRLL